MGIGIDIVDIDKIDRLIEKWGDRFLNRIFTDRELKEWELRGKRVSLLAGKFATKEAFFKANNSKEDWRFVSIKWKEIEVLDIPSGAPVIWVKGQKTNTNISISHTQQIAISVVVSECFCT